MIVPIFPDGVEKFVEHGLWFVMMWFPFVAFWSIAAMTVWLTLRVVWKHWKERE